jgi:hypothetical protein
MWILPIMSPVVIICTISLTVNNSTFCPHSVFTCFVWIWEQRLFPYTALTDWFVEPRQCVYCAVRTGFLNTITVNFRLKHSNLFSFIFIFMLVIPEGQAGEIRKPGNKWWSPPHVKAPHYPLGGNFRLSLPLSPRPRPPIPSLFRKYFLILTSHLSIAFHIISDFPTKILYALLRYMPYTFVLKRLVAGLTCGGFGSIPGQSLWNLGCTNKHWGWFPS